jgi:hypothetical protein
VILVARIALYALAAYLLWSSLEYLLGDASTRRYLGGAESWGPPAFAVAQLVAAAGLLIRRMQTKAASLFALLMLAVVVNQFFHRVSAALFVPLLLFAWAAGPALLIAALGVDRERRGRSPDK